MTPGPGLERCASRDCLHVQYLTAMEGLGQWGEHPLHSGEPPPSPRTVSLLLSPRSMTHDAPAFYRAMRRSSSGFPEIGNTARCLGARPKYEQEDGDIPVDATGYVQPRTGGMSMTFKDPHHLPQHRRPKSLGGVGKDPVFCFVGPSPDTLVPRQDTRANPHHFVLEPAGRCLFTEFTRNIATTQPKWEEVR